MIQYIEANRRVWQQKLIENKDMIIAVMIPTNIVIHTKKESIQSLGSQLTINNVLTTHAKEFKVLEEDLSPLLGNKF